jgi:hypothetical protein
LAPYEQQPLSFYRVQSVVEIFLLLTPTWIKEAVKTFKPCDNVKEPELDALVGQAQLDARRTNSTRSRTEIVWTGFDAGTLMDDSASHRGTSRADPSVFWSRPVLES